MQMGKKIQTNKQTPQSQIEKSHFNVYSSSFCTETPWSVYYCHSSDAMNVH